MLPGLVILSYHKFNPSESDYVFSRTYKQFRNDLETKDFDLITIDDATKCQIKACKMMRDLNFRAKLFTPTALVGTAGRCTWDEIWTLSKHHDIENHSHNHVLLTELSGKEIKSNIETANKMIKDCTGRRPRFFVPPWNTSNDLIDEIAGQLGLIILKNRITIKNISR